MTGIAAITGRGSLCEKGVGREKALEELRGWEKLSRGELLRRGVRYFSEGLVSVSGIFVEEEFASRRECFGVKRKRGAGGLPLTSSGLCCLGDLEKEVLS